MVASVSQSSMKNTFGDHFPHGLKAARMIMKTRSSHEPPIQILSLNWERKKTSFFVNHPEYAVAYTRICVSARP
jgi:hypothetical protein